MNTDNNFPTYQEERDMRLWTAIKYGVVYPLGFILITGFCTWLFDF